MNAPREVVGAAGTMESCFHDLASTIERNLVAGETSLAWFPAEISPFDLPEAESELVAGYFAEYSDMRFALFFAAEYAAMIIMSSIATICFLGGWTIPKFFTDVLPFLAGVPGIVWFLLKLYCILFLYYWVRATLPRYRYDHLMNLGWNVLIPLALINIVITGIIKVLV